MISAGLGITVASVAHGEIIQNAMRGLVSIPVVDAERVPLSLVGRNDRLSPLVESLRAVAGRVCAELEPEPRLAA